MQIIRNKTSPSASLRKHEVVTLNSLSAGSGKRNHLTSLARFCGWHRAWLVAFINPSFGDIIITLAHVRELHPVTVNTGANRALALCNM